ncbi:MAG: adenylate/guanylate cyclase domain-containing protein [Acidimicrobiia bacterium]
MIVWGGVSHIELMWENAAFARIFRRLGSFSRVIQFDRRGVGMSDRTPGLATLETRMEDVRAVMDAAGCERVALFGESEGGPMSMLFAATYPERTTGLVLYGPLVRLIADETFPWAWSREDFEALLDSALSDWGAEDQIAFWAPSVADDPAARRFFSRFTRLSGSPGSFKDQMMMNADIDVRPVLHAVNVPTLVLHRTGDLVVDVHQGRYAARHIPGAKFVELPGADHFLMGGDPEQLVDEVEEFLTGVRGQHEVDRILATVAFTDIVGSTQRAAELGDREWRNLLDQHDAAVRRELQRFNGREVNTTGDGMLAAFDGPARGIRCARAITEAMEPLGVEIRAGLHTGECEVRGSDLGGLAVHIAARVGSLAAPGEVLVSSTVKDLVAGSGITFTERGTHVLKGVPDEWRLYSVES